MALISALVGPPRPILVICGGPSAAEGLKKIPLGFPKFVISANEHGFKQDRFKVDAIVSVDFTYGGTRQPMSEFMSQFGVPNINRWSWADYRLPEWNFNGDSGLTAVCVAVLLGGHPVIVTGLDRNCGNKRYFWHTAPDPRWSKRIQPNISNIRTNTKHCVSFCRDAHVRVTGGPMLAYWPEFIHNEAYPRHNPCAAPQTHLTGDEYTVTKQMFIHPTDRVDGGRIILTPNEAAPQLRLGKICRTQPTS